MALAKNSEEMATLVGDYLLKHPDFLNDHPHILERLNLSHQTAGNISSLIELQVERLRERHRYQQRQIDYLHQASEYDQDITLQVQAAALELVKADSIHSLYERLFKTCRDNFNVHDLNIFLFADKDPGFRQKKIYFESRGSGFLRMFTELFNRNKPLCDSLQQEYLQILFSGDEPVQSTLLIPHIEKDYHLLFAFGSHRLNAYKQGYELKLIEFLVAVFVVKFNELHKQKISMEA